MKTILRQLSQMTVIYNRSLFPLQDSKFAFGEPSLQHLIYKFLAVLIPSPIAGVGM